MATTPLYRSLKSNGTSFYAFPSAAEDISASYQNSNYKMYFSKYALLNIPKQNTVSVSGSTQSNPVYMDFENAFSKSVNSTQAPTFQDQMIESLRNYVANHEVVIKESRLNNTSYYYDNNALETTTEKIFFKWAKKLNIIDFEPAIPDDEYFSNLSEFVSKNLNDDQYFPEYLWKEREVTPYDTKSFYQSSVIANMLEIEFQTNTNLRTGDIARIYNTGVPEGELPIRCKVLRVIDADGTNNQRVIFDVLANTLTTIFTTGKVELVYNRLVQYIGEVIAVSNVQEANRSYTEVHANIPDHTGKTPDILFRTMVDSNYKPSLTFPIIPSQFQPEIMGAESFSSPIVSNPQNYPGSYFGQFDTLDFTYETSTGDSLRRSGNYFGVNGDLNSPIINGSTIDGISMDFNTNHYVKMNILGRNLTNFDQFNALSINNNAPEAFEFNAILWYYNVEDSSGNVRTNLYGISFVDNPDNTEIDSERGLKFPTYKKFVSNGFQDGTSFGFSLNLNFNIINDNIQEVYNPEAINSMFSMNLFNQAMSRLASTNDSFLNLISEQGLVRDEVNALKGLLYTQTDISVINSKIQSLETLLRLYSTNQIISSDSINVSQIPGTPPSISLSSNATSFERVYSYKATDMYNAQGIIPANLAVPNNRDFLVNFINDDVVSLDLQNDDKLTFILDRDLYYRQSVEFNINANSSATENKKIDIYIKSDITSTTSNTTEVLVIGSINIPVYYNSIRQLPNSSFTWEKFAFNIDISENENIILNVGNKLELKLKEPGDIVFSSIKAGDTLLLNNFFIIDGSSIYDFSDQYTVQSSTNDGKIILDISSNKKLVDYTEPRTLPFNLNTQGSSLLANIPFFSLNKGKKVKLTRVSDSLNLNERYLLQVTNL